MTEKMATTPPKRYQKIKQQFPELIEAYEKLGEASKKGPLSDKYIHLIKLGAAAAMRSEGAVHSHARRAIEAGATIEEIRHAVILLTSTIGFSTMMAALSWTDDVLNKG